MLIKEGFINTNPNLHLPNYSYGYQTTVQFASGWSTNPELSALWAHLCKKSMVMYLCVKMDRVMKNSVNYRLCVSVIEGMVIYSELS